MYDTIIRGGRIVDGTGAPAFIGDIAIQDGKIAAVGEVDGTAHQEIDAAGLMVAPGWVDAHSHMDGQATWDPICSPALNHGITTLVMGNCGVGFAPCLPTEKAHRELIEVMEDVEDIPGSALDEGITWSWESFPEYLDTLEAMPRAVDVAAQLPHCALRVYVMGDRGVQNEEATPEDIARMAELTKEAIAAGAIGFSTSRTELHMTRHGEVMPGTYSAEDELLGIGKSLGEVGRGVYQLVSDWKNWEQEMQWMKKLSIENQCQINFTIFYQTEDQWPRVLKQLEFVKAANAEGAKLVPNIGLRPVSVLMNFNGTVNPFFLHQNFAKLADLTPDERLEELRKPEVRAAILAEPTPVMGHEVGDRMTSDFDMMFELGEEPNYEPKLEDSIGARARAAGVTPQEYAYDALLKRDGQAMIYFPVMGYDCGNLERQLDMLDNEHSVISLSDTGAHCGVLCDASIPTQLLAYFTRDRVRGRRLPVEDAIKMHTADTANCMGLTDRGTLEVGKKADINIIDYDNLKMNAPKMSYDLPAGGRRVFQDAEGYRYTLVSGEVVMRDGVATEARPGQLIRAA
jgi:N-acyl-D-aspartate/D-glutamate deacylase